MIRYWLIVLWAGMVVFASRVAAQTTVFPATPRPDLWSNRHFLPIGSLVLAATMGSLRLARVSPNLRAVFGRRFPLKGDLKTLEKTEIDLPYQEHDTVSELELQLFAWGSGIAAVAANASFPCDPQTGSCKLKEQVVFDTTAGFISTFFLTYAVTEAFKFGFGRLRPDFVGRLRKSGCDKYPTRSACLRGRMSFVSGHSSMSFGTATYASLVIGGRMVWGLYARESSDWSPKVLGVMAQAFLLGYATYIAITRVKDHRHHWDDVLVGVLIGVAVANLSYWLYFDHNGLPHDRGDTISSTGQSLLTRRFALPPPVTLFSYQGRF